MKKVERAEFPLCDMCKSATAMCDAPTISGAWGYLCPDCLSIFGGPNAEAVGFEFVLPGEKRRSEDTLAKEISDAIYAGDFDLVEELVGDGDLAEFL